MELESALKLKVGWMDLVLMKICFSYQDQEFPVLQKSA